MPTSPSTEEQEQPQQSLGIKWIRPTNTTIVMTTSIVIGFLFLICSLRTSNETDKSVPSDQRVLYSPPKPLFRNQTDPTEEKSHCNFVEAMMQIDTINVVLLEEMDKFRARLDSADSEPSSELDSQSLMELWQVVALELHQLVHHSRLINVKGKWEMQLLFEEYYAFNQADLAARIDSPNLMMLNLIRILNSLLGVSNKITHAIQQASKANSQVRRLLYLKGKKLSNTISQSGILQHFLRLVFGDMWVRQRKYELQLVHEGIELSQAISQVLGQFEFTFELYNETGNLLLYI
ncbi:hypothetical protein PGT21_019811 [Puccinia graminis f. sp. tritici]|uniref:Uncharacterized protein n=1 Tax=Puccinia graminis f. sp. tritici TaxID=56615 RepID=A0A5B0NG22_PUCGR|nr:hypothetical protein PGT21_019811 [Puccinia graminis f. sp. tritici]